MKRIYGLLLVCLLPGLARGTILRVPSQYPTIQAGLNAANTGDTVLVASGTYNENIAWPAVDGILLTSESGPGSTAINGGGNGSVIRFGGGLSRATILEGFTIENGRATSGGGINTSSASSPSIRNNRIRKNVATGGSYSYGGGIYFYNASPLITGNTLLGNSCVGTSWNYGGGIYSGGASHARVSGNVIQEDSTLGGYWNYGSGIYCDMGSRDTVCDNLILANVGTGGDRAYGVGIYSGLRACPYLFNNLIVGNVARSGSWNYGAGIYSDTSATIVNNTITGNSCSGGNWNYGAGIWLQGSYRGTIANNIIVQNSASQGGGIGAYTGAAPVLLNNDVWSNAGGDYYGISPGPRDISRDPLFASGMRGNYYLSQVAAGQTMDSPCLDSGSTRADSLGLDRYTTRTDSVNDRGIVDIGFHYPTTLVNAVEGGNPGRSQARGLRGTHPNPFSGQTVIRYALSAPASVHLGVYNISGHVVRELASGPKPAGTYEVLWDGRDDSGKPLPSGVYLLRFESGSYHAIQKAVLLR